MEEGNTSFIELENVDIASTTAPEALISSLLLGVTSSKKVNVGAFVRLLESVEKNEQRSREQLLAAADFARLALRPVVSNCKWRDDYVERWKELEDAQIPYLEKRRAADRLGSPFDTSANGTMFDVVAAVDGGAFTGDAFEIRFLAGDRLAVDAVVAGGVAATGETADVTSYAERVDAAKKSSKVSVAFNELFIDKGGNRVQTADATADGERVFKLALPVRRVATGEDVSSVTALPYMGAVVDFPSKQELRGSTVTGSSAEALLDLVVPTDEEALAMVEAGEIGNVIDAELRAKEFLPCFRLDARLAPLLETHFNTAIREAMSDPDDTEPPEARALAPAVDWRSFLAQHLSKDAASHAKPDGAKPPAEEPGAAELAIVDVGVVPLALKEDTIVRCPFGYVAPEAGGGGGGMYDPVSRKVVLLGDVTRVAQSRALAAAHAVFETSGVKEFNAARERRAGALKAPRFEPLPELRAPVYFSNEYRRLTKYNGDPLAADETLIVGDDGTEGGAGGFERESGDDESSTVEEAVAGFVASVFGTRYADAPAAAHVIASATRFFVERQLRARAAGVIAKRDMHFERPPQFWLPLSLYESMMTLHNNKEPLVLRELKLSMTYFIGAVTIELVRIRMFQIVEVDAAKALSADEQRRRIGEAFERFAPGSNKQHLAKCVEIVHGFERLIRSIGAGDAHHIKSHDDSRYSLARWPAYRPSASMSAIASSDRVAAFLVALHKELAEKPPRRIGKGGELAVANQVISEKPLDEFAYHDQRAVTYHNTSAIKANVVYRSTQGVPTVAEWKGDVRRIDQAGVAEFEVSEAATAPAFLPFVEANHSLLGGKFQSSADVEKNAIEPAFEHVSPDVQAALFGMEKTKRRTTLSYFLQACSRVGHVSISKAELLEEMGTGDAVSLLMLITLRVFEEKTEHMTTLLAMLTDAIAAVHTTAESMLATFEKLRQEARQKLHGRLDDMDDDTRFMYQDIVRAKIGDWEPREEDAAEMETEAIPVARDDQDND
jgi:hypothetical protein